MSNAGDRMETVPRRWTLHGLNSGGVFGFTYHGVRVLPRVVSYAIGHVGSSIVARANPESTGALIDNLRAVFPGARDRELRRHAVQVYRSYTRDVIDFIHALDAPDPGALFEYAGDAKERVTRMQARGRGVLLVSGHFGNWEAGGVLMSRCLDLPLTVVAMREASEAVNRIRRQVRDRLGIETIEVRQSLDTPLRIRAALAQNRFVAMLVDRHVGRDRIGVSLLGRHAWFLRTPFTISALTGATIVMCSIERRGPLQFYARLGPEIVVDPARPREEAVQWAAQQVADQLSDAVRMRPDAWYQFYRYWDAQRDDYTGLD